MDEDELNRLAQEASNDEIDAQALEATNKELDGQNANPNALLSAIQAGADAARPRPTPSSIVDGIGLSLGANGVSNTSDPNAVQRSEEDNLRAAGIYGPAQAVGAARAAYETRDFIAGEQSEDEKSGLRKSIEGAGKEISEGSTVGSVVQGVSQFVTGLIGVGKLLGPIKVLQKSKFAYETGKAAIAGAVAMDPHEERLSNLVESFPELQNPITGFLAAKPDDTAAEGRLKNALESIGMDFALVGALKAFKFLRAGKTEEAATVLKEIESERAANARGRVMEESQIDLSPETPQAGDKSGSPSGTVDIPQEAPQGGTEKAGEVPANPDVPRSANTSTEQVRSSAPIGPDGKPIVPTEVRQPDVVKTQEVTDQQLDDILNGSKADSDAVAQYGSREAAIENGYQFAKSAPLPWQKLRGSVEAQNFVRQAATVLKDRFDFAKGGDILSDSRVKDVTDELAKAYNEEPAMLVGQLADAGEAASQMVPFMEASLRIGNKMFQDADDLARRIRAGNLDEFAGSLKTAQEELKARVAAAVDVMSYGHSVLSNAGRAVRRARSQFQFSVADLNSIKDIDPAKLAVVMEKAGGDTSKIMTLANRPWQRRVLDEATWHLTNGLLWLWPTHLVNTTTNAMMLASRPTEKLFGSMAASVTAKDVGKRAELLSVAKQAKREYLYTITSLADGWSNAVEAFKRGDSILSPHNTEYTSGGGHGISPEPLNWNPVRWKSALGVWDLARNAWMSANYRNIVGLPTRTLGGADEFFKTLRYRAVIQSRAAVDASEQGLDTVATKEYIQKALNDAIDPMTGQALDANALREAQTVSFQQDLNYDTTFGNFGQAVTNARRTAPALQLVLPFVKTPVNVIRYGMKLTPGLNLAQKEFRDAFKGLAGPEAQAHAYGQMIMGSMFSGLAAHLALNGRLTGAGPADQRLRSELVNTGWKPYSIVWTDSEGKKNYFQLGRFDPVGMSMGLVADVIGLMQKNPDADYGDALGAIAIAVAKNLGQKTFLQNLNSALEATLDPENKLPKYVGRTVGSMLPGSSLLREVNPDPYMREARGFVDNIIRGVPGLSETLPKSYNVFGEPLETKIGVTDSQDGDLVESEHNRIMLQTNKGLGKPTTNLDGVDLRDITLKDGTNAYEKFQQLSGKLPGYPTLKELLAKTIKSDEYHDMSDGDPDVKGTRLNALGQVTQRYRQSAMQYLVRQYPELQPLIKQRQREARGAFLKNQQQRRDGDPGARELLESLTGVR